VPRLSVWFVRTALLYLGVGFTFGALMLLNKGLPVHPALWRLLPVHIEWLTVGWTMNLALGVAYWILPRYKLGPARGPAWPVWLAYSLLNSGVLAASLAQGLAVPGPLGEGLNVFGKVLEAIAALAFAWHALPRIKPHGA
jgi:hypothetical protein